nr:aldehyde dehydrogenase family protein [Pseudonocardia kujensis]
MLEIGGSDAFVVLDDAGVERAAEAAVASRFQNAGRSCACAKRFLVASSLAEEFTALVVRRTEKLVVGPRPRPGWTSARWPRADLRATLHRQVVRSVEQGARVLCGGYPLDGPGNFYRPTLLADTGPGVTAFDEEPFSPVAAMTNVVVLAQGESATSPRVLAMTDSWVGAAIHFAYEMWSTREDEDAVPPPFRPFWEQYCTHVAAMATPADRRYLELHDGHATWLSAAERRFLTEDAVRAVTIVGTADEVVEQIRQAERAGVTELALQSPLATARDVMREFAERVRPALSGRRPRQAVRPGDT